MTFLIVFLAITNMAVGYGLAVYLGKSKQPIQITRGRFRKRKAEVAASIEVASEELTVPMAEAEPSIPAEANEASAMTGSDSSEVKKSTEKPALAQQVEAAAPKAEAEEEEKPVPQQVMQLDVSDLTPGAQPSAKATTPEQLSDEPGEKLAVEETTKEPDQQPNAEVVAETVEEPEELLTAIESDESIPSEEPAAATVEPAAQQPEPEEPEPEEVDELESLAQMLQTAVAESSVEEEIEEENDIEFAEAVAAQPVEVGEAAAAIVDEQPEAAIQSRETRQPLETDQPVETVAADDHETASAAREASVESEELLNGLEAFQQQLQQQSEQEVDEVVVAEPAETRADETAEMNQAPEADSVLAGIAAFQGQLQQQTSQVEPTSQAEPADDSELEPEVLAGIESFRSQLAQMKNSPPPLAGDESDDLVEATATT